MTYEVQVLQFPKNGVVAVERFETTPDLQQTMRLSYLHNARFIVLYNGAEIARMRNKEVFRTYMTSISCAESVLS